MILKGLKTKSIQKATKKSILERTLLPNNEKINTIGLLISLSNFKILEQELKSLSADFNSKQLQTLIYSFKPKKETEPSVITPKHFGWKGILKQDQLKQAVSTEVDVLIAFTEEVDVYFEYLFAKSSAKFKVTNHPDLEFIADLTIHSKTDNFSNFKTELIKYLTILKKL